MFATGKTKNATGVWVENLTKPGKGRFLHNKTSFAKKQKKKLPKSFHQKIKIIQKH